MSRSNRDPRARPLVVGLLWHSVNSDNLGIGALTQSHIAILEKIGRELGLCLQFHVLGWLDRREPYTVGPNILAVPLKARDFLPGGGLYGAARRCDIVCDIGAGDSFSDIYGVRRFAFLTAAKAIVLAARRPLVLSPQTIGPFRHRWTARVAKHLIRRCRVVAVRDEPSLAMTDKLKVRRDVILSTDVAFRLPYTPPAPNGNRVQVGLNVSGLLFNGGYDRRNMFGLRADYPALARSLCRHFSELANCQLHLVGHVNSDDHEVEDDYRVAVELAKAFPKATVAPRFRSPSEAKSYLARMDFMCGSRMHACIAALSSGVPVLPIAYSRKFHGLFGSLGYPHFADCRTETTEAIVRRVVDAFENRAALRTAAEGARARAEERLATYEEALRRCLAAAAAA